MRGKMEAAMKRLMLLLAIAAWCLAMAGCAKMPTRGEYTVLDSAPSMSADSDSAIIYFLRLLHKGLVVPSKG
jgi:hypothetical protein